jgi:hypothetical protein
MLSTLKLRARERPGFLAAGATLAKLLSFEHVEQPEPAGAGP